jgi:hypothetical protein
MRIARFAAILVAMTISVPAFAQSFLGQWTATADVQGTKVAETLTVTKTDDGYALAAKPEVEPPPGAPTAGPGIEIVIEGDNFSFKRVLDFGGQSVNIFYEGVVSGDTFTGAAEIDGFPNAVAYNGVRISDGE